MLFSIQCDQNVLVLAQTYSTLICLVINCSVKWLDIVTNSSVESSHIFTNSVVKWLDVATRSSVKIRYCHQFLCQMVRHCPQFWSDIVICSNVKQLNIVVRSSVK